MEKLDYFDKTYSDKVVYDLSTKSLHIRTTEFKIDLKLGR
jgi:hypothetical protein